MSEDVKPALTPSEWHEWGVMQTGDYNKAPMIASVAAYHRENDLSQLNRPHALAALCLHGQSFGFTWDDVRQLRLYAEESPWMDELASRIAALLPPSQPWGSQVMYHDLPPETP